MVCVNQKGKSDKPDLFDFKAALQKNMNRIYTILTNNAVWKFANTTEFAN